MVEPIRRLGTTFLILALIAASLFLWLRGPIQQTVSAALKAYPVYSFVRVRNELFLRADHEGRAGANLLVHRGQLSGPRDRSVTTPNSDTLYSTAFLDRSFRASGGFPLSSRCPKPG